MDILKILESYKNFMQISLFTPVTSNVKIRNSTFIERIYRKDFKEVSHVS